MKNRSFSAAGLLFAGYLSMASGPCTPSAVLVCPAGTFDDGSGTGNCISDPTSGTALGAALQPGGLQTGFFYMGADSGFTLGNGSSFSTTVSTNQAFTPDITATFGKGPLPPPTVGVITEQFNAVAVYSQSQATNAALLASYDGLYLATTDVVTGVTSDLTGYIVAVGNTLTTSGDVVSFIARYSPRGTLDPTFNGTGYLLGSPGGFTGGAFTSLTSVAIDLNGNIIVGGYGNSQPSISTYLVDIQSGDGNPNGFGASGDELQGFVARYTPWGTIDSSFDSTTANGPPDGSAYNGFAKSPATGFGGFSTANNRKDVVFGVATDLYGGVYAVGSTANSFSPYKYQLPFIVHYSNQGVLDAEALGASRTWSLSGGQAGGLSFYNAASNPVQPGPSAFELLRAVAVDPVTGAVTVAGVSKGATKHAFVARFLLINPGQPNEFLKLDPSFNTTGFDLLPALGAFDNVNALALDSVNGQIVLAGETQVSGSDWRPFIYGVNSTTAALKHFLGGATGYAGGTKDTFNSVAVVNTYAPTLTTRYVAVGSSRDTGTPATLHSLVAAFIPATLAQDASLDTSAYSKAPPGNGYATPLPPFSNSSFPNPFAVVGGRTAQLGPNGGVYGGGISEKFTGIALSTDGQSAIVVGYTTDATTAPLTGRSFPILLEYGQGFDFFTTAGGVPTWDYGTTWGTLINMGDTFHYPDFFSLQYAF